MPIIRPVISTTPDSPIVTFREDPKNINLDIEIPKLLVSQGGGWELGTIFSVRFVNHERTKLIKVARFIVTLEDSSIQTFSPDGPQPMTKLVEAREVRQIENWFYPDRVLLEDNNSADGSEKIVKWNFGDGKFRVTQGDNILFRSKNKKEAEQFRDAA